jgi:site-specific DNA recombinase
MPPRAIGIIRVSRLNKREGDRFASPHIQRQRIEDACEREGLTLLEVHEELDESAGKPLDTRSGLGPAVRAIEDGQADVIVGAYFDRLFRKLTAQDECVERVEKAGGRVLAVDVGTVSNKSAGLWLSSSMLGLVAEYHRRTTVERVHGALERAIERGVPPYGHVTAGYLKRDDGRWEPDPDVAPVVAGAFRLRADGATVDEAWQHLLAGGVQITYGGAYALLSSRAVLGEIHFGKFEPNLNAHEPIVDRATWEAVQRVRVPSGRKPQSERLLARLGVLRCATCRSRMAGSTATGSTSKGGGGGRTYPIYRCGNKDCERQMSIMAHVAEAAVRDAVRAHMAGLKGTAAASARANETRAQLERSQAALEAGIRTLSLVGEEPAAIERLAALKRDRDEWRAKDERSSGIRQAEAVDLTDPRVSVTAWRSIIRASVSQAVVHPGRGPGRVRVEFLGE